MFRSGRFRVLVSVSAAFPISSRDGEVVYNFRGSVDTANFLGQLFRTLSQVLNINQPQPAAVEQSPRQQPRHDESSGLSSSTAEYEPMSSSSAGGGADNQMEALTNKLSQFSLRKRKKRRRKRKAVVVPTKKPEPKQQLVRSLRLWDDQGPSLTRWDASTRTLLNITLTFLRHAPERVVNHPRNRGIVSRLLDLTSPEAVASFRSRTVIWSSLLAMHLLYLSPIQLGENERIAASSALSTPSSSPSKTSPLRRRAPPRRKRRSSKKKLILF